MDHVKKLHVDRHVPGGREAAMPDAWSLVQRIARCARSEIDTVTTEGLIREAQRWLESDSHKELVRTTNLIMLDDILCYLRYYAVSGSGRCVLGSGQVQVTPGAISRPAGYNNIAIYQTAPGRGNEG